MLLGEERWVTRQNRKRETNIWWVSQLQTIINTLHRNTDSSSNPSSPYPSIIQFWRSRCHAKLVFPGGYGVALGYNETELIMFLFSLPSFVTLINGTICYWFTQTGVSLLKRLFHSRDVNLHPINYRIWSLFFKF